MLPLAGLALTATLSVAAARQEAGGPANARFEVVDVFIDSGDVALGAWQVELRDTRGVAKISAIEGGDHPAFREAPRYDPAALSGTLDADPLGYCRSFLRWSCHLVGFC